MLQNDLLLISILLLLINFGIHEGTFSTFLEELRCSCCCVVLAEKPGSSQVSVTRIPLS